MVVFVHFNAIETAAENAFQSDISSAAQVPIELGKYKIDMASHKGERLCLHCVPQQFFKGNAVLPESFRMHNALLQSAVVSLHNFCLDTIQKDGSNCLSNLKTEFSSLAACSDPERLNNSSVNIHWQLCQAIVRLILHLLPQHSKILFVA